MQANTAGLRVIRRNADGTVLDFPLSYDAIAKGTQAPLLLQPQDIVYVPMSKIKAILSDTTGIVSSAASAAIINTGR
jgi:GTP:adenosylcobinamide-phosphate guanylyltransferase